MKTNRMSVQLLCLFIGLFLIGSFWAELHATSSVYPDRAITMVVPLPPGGVTDLSARTLAANMEKHLKQPVVVVNKPGGAMTIGGYAVVTAKPDGYTLGFFPVASVLPEVYTYFQVASYSSKDLRPISSVAQMAQPFVVKADAPWDSFKDIVEYARKNPGMKIGTGGKQTMGYMVMAEVARKERVSFTNVPFAGGPEILPALLGGHVPVGVMDYAQVKSMVDAKKLKILVMCTEKRVEFAPDIPTVVELGYRLAYVPILGLFGPKAMPDEFVKKIDDLVGKISEEQDFRTRMKNYGIQPRYEDNVSYEKTLIRYKDSLQAFFKEEGLVK